MKVHSIMQRYHELGIREHKFLAGLSNFNLPGTIEYIKMNQKNVIEINMAVSKKIRGINHLTGRLCRGFDGCVTDSFTVTLQNNS